MKIKPPAAGGYKIDKDREWRARLEEKNQQFRQAQPSLASLEERLTGVGGAMVCLTIEEDLDAILSRSITITTRPKMMRGDPSNCHGNAAACWEANQEACRIATGYALSADGLWRQHSWVVVPKDARPMQSADPANPAHWKVVETTVPRLAYHGFVMSEEECGRFADNQ